MQAILNDFKTRFKPKSTHSILTGITSNNELLGVVYEKIEIRSYKRGTTDIAESHCYYTKAKTIEKFEKDLEPYIEKI